MKSIDLFSGIGGFALGLSWAGIETIAFCETDLFCRKVLAKNFPGAVIHGDIKTFRAKPYRGFVDIVCGGFPCQPFSYATRGRSKKKEDSRYLWPKMHRVIRECRPRWVLAENVDGFVRLGLDDVLSDLEASDYTAAAAVLPACSVGAPHRRNRLWILAHANSQSERLGAIDAKMACPQAIAHTVSEPLREQSRRRSGANRTNETQPRFTRWESVEPLVCRGNDGVPDRMDRLRALGNAVVPQVVYQLGRAIVRADSLHCG